MEGVGGGVGQAVLVVPMWLMGGEGTSTHGLIVASGGQSLSLVLFS